MKVVLVLLLVLLVALYGIWQFRTRHDAEAEQRARVLRLDPRKVEPATRALLLLETLPGLEGAERELAVKQLRDALRVVPRALLVHSPPFEVQTLRFSGDGYSMLWYGEPMDGRITIEKSLQRAPRVVSWTAESTYATFLDDAGEKFLHDQQTGNAPEMRRMSSSDGRYLAVARDDLVVIWRVRAPKEPGTLVADLPQGTKRLHCAESTGLCAIESPNAFTVADVKKRRILRSIPAGRNATVHVSPSARLVGVAGPREGITIHSALQDRKIHLDTDGLAPADFAFSTDERSVVVLASDGVLQSYEVATGKPVTRSAVLRSEQWKPGAHVEAAGDGRYVVWDAKKVRLVSADLSAVTARFDEGGNVILVKPNGRGDRLAIVREGELTLWDISAKQALPVPEDELIEAACDHVGRSLTAEEWANYLPDRRYAPTCH